MNSGREHSRGRYKAASVHPEARMLIARVAPLLKAEGLSYKRQREIYAEAGHGVSERSFCRHRACEDEGHAALSSKKNSGRPKVLMDGRLWFSLVGFCIKMTKTKKLAFETANAFIEDNFCMKI